MGLAKYLFKLFPIPQGYAWIRHFESSLLFWVASGIYFNIKSFFLIFEVQVYLLFI